MAKGIIANSVMNGAAGMLMLVTGFVSSVITARLLGPEANGVIAFSLWLVLTGASIAELGSSVTMSRALPKLRAEGFDEQRRRGFAAILVRFMIGSTSLILLFYGLFFLTSERLHWDETSPTVALITAILFAVQAIGSFVKYYLICEKRLVDFFKLAVMVAIVQISGVAVGALVLGTNGVLIGYALGQFVLLAATLPILFTRADWCGVSLKYILSSSAVFSAQFIIDSIFLNRLELLFLQQFWSVEMVGFYAVGLSIANIALQLPIQMTGSLLPYYAEKRHMSTDRTLPVEVFSAVTRSMAYIVLPMSFGLAAISAELVRVVFGEAYARSGTVVALLALAAPSYTFMQTLSFYIISMDRMKARLKVSVIAAFAMAFGCLFVVPFFAAEGAAFVRISVFTIMCAIMLKQTGFGARLSGLYANLAKVTAASLCCALAALGLLQLVDGALGLALAVALGGLAYLLAMRLLKAVPAEDAEVLQGLVDKVPAALAPALRRMADFVAPQAQQKAGARTSLAGGAGLAGAGRAAALPLVVADSIGLFMPETAGTAKRSAAVLFVSPWGLEDLASRKFFRIAAERFADLGIASLRFDYPGTGDALDPAEPADLNAWRQSLVDAAARLKHLAQVEEIVLIGQGIGATLAHQAAGRIEGVKAVAMLAPVLSGRSYLREVALWAKIIDADLGVASAHLEAGRTAIASLVLPEPVETELRGLKPAALGPAAAARYLVLERPVRAEDRSFTDRLIAEGVEAEHGLFEGYDELATNPLFAEMPHATVDRLSAWLESLTFARPHAPASLHVNTEDRLLGADFEEVPVRFGAFDHLIGVVTLPKGEIEGRSVVFLSTAYDRHSGWGRQTVTAARALARAGIASLRFDSADAADSPPRPDTPRQIMYSPTQVEDTQAALDLLARFAPGRDVIAAGRCSGAYVGMHAAAADARLSGIVAINPFVFYWDPAASVEREHVVSVPRSLDDYGQRLFSLRTAKRLFTGRINVVEAAKNIAIALGRRISPLAAPLLNLLPGRRAMAREVYGLFSKIVSRRQKVTLVYSDADVGLDHLYFYFGKNGSRLKRYGDVRFVTLPGTDHNLTPESSRQTVLEEILALAKAA